MNLVLHYLQTNSQLVLLGAMGVFAFLVLIILLLAFQIRKKHLYLLKKNKRLKEDQHTITTLREEETNLKIRIAKLVTLLKNERRQNSEKLMLLEEAKEQLGFQFESLAGRIFEEKNNQFIQERGKRVEAMLKPFQDQLQLFQKRMNDIQVDDIKERTSLKKEIEQLRELNNHINQETSNLTRALRADKKFQGSWGELVLERILEKSGLRKGHEYSSQNAFRNRDHQLQKPDIIIHLPDGKDIIIDSKVTLTGWEKLVNAETKEQKKKLLANHIQNLKNHINGLSEKDYSNLPGINSLDFVLLFMPIESAFTVAYEADPGLFSSGYEKNIIVVSPTTLLATLRTIENLWRIEHQNRNAKEIAERAGSIYNKLKSFLDEMEKIGKQLGNCTSTYEAAMNKLTTGRGNLISQAEKLTDLGVKVKTKIKSDLKNEHPN